MNYGFVKVAAAIPRVTVADCVENGKEIKSLIAEAENQGVEVVVFPELCITGYTCGDLFLNPTLLKAAQRCLYDLADYTIGMNIIAIVGLPLEYQNVLYNVAAVIHNGIVRGIVPKWHLPNYREFYEKRWFSSGERLKGYTYCDYQDRRCKDDTIPLSSSLLFHTPSFNFTIEICEDLWGVIPRSAGQCLQGADIVFNLSASNEVVGKHNYLKRLLRQQSAGCLCGYVYAGAGYGESTTDCVFGGNALIYENGTLLAEGERFSLNPQLIVSEIDVENLRAERRVNKTFADAPELEEDYFHDITIDTDIKHRNNIFLSRTVDPTPFVPKGERLDEHCTEVFNIQVMGLCRRLEHTRSRTVVVGISGGLDSTLALLVCVKAFDKLRRPRKDIVGITMPGFGTTDRTYNNAIGLMTSLGVTIREISIKEACIQHFSDIEHDMSVHDVTYENSQARERTQILMDVANRLNGLVIGTGDLSELALGWATYNGDHMSMYGVNAGVPKTLIQHLVGWVADNRHVDEESTEILRDIIDTPISPELIPADEQGNIRQKTEDLVGPYELHDFFLFHFMRHGARPEKIFYLAQLAFAGKYADETIKKWLTTFFRRFFNQQFKRSCLPDGPKVGSVSLSPRGDWRMPSDASSTEWLKECERL